MTATTPFAFVACSAEPVRAAVLLYAARWHRHAAELCCGIVRAAWLLLNKYSTLYTMVHVQQSALVK